MSPSSTTPAFEATDADGNVHAPVGYRAMRPAPGSERFQSQHGLSEGDLPKKVDMRSMMTPVEDQGATSSCVANAVAGAYEYWIKRLNDTEFDISRLVVYYNARWRAGDQDEDAGSYIQLAMEGLGDFGACSEATWPFEKALLKEKPGRAAYEEGAAFRVRDRQQVPLDLVAWKQSLAEGLPIVFGCVLFESFDQCNQLGGVVPMPSPEEVQRESHGGHSMCAVGYSDVEGVFIVRNSWGSQWGDGGYCYMPYNYLLNPRFNDGDCWVFVPDHELPLPHDVWADDDTPVVNNGQGVDFVINTYEVSEYSTITIDFFESIETVEYTEETSEEYVEYVEYVEEEDWEELDDVDYEDLLDSDDDEESDEDEEPDEEAEDDVEDEDDEDASEVDDESDEDESEEYEEEDEEDEEDGDEEAEDDAEEESDDSEEDAEDEGGDDEYEEEEEEEDSDDSGEED